MSGTLHLIIHTLFTGCAVVGAITISNKIGKFIKQYDNEKEDNFKKAFDKSMGETINDIHSCIESVSVITNGMTRASSVAIDLCTGSKVLTRKKGQFMIVEQSKAQKQQIDELSSKLKKYESEIEKLKRKRKEKREQKRTKDDDDERSDTQYSSGDEASVSSLSDQEDGVGKKKDEYTKEYTLGSSSAHSKSSSKK
jgi:outer membrane murein-binding lipoprotein Lpp